MKSILLFGALSVLSHTSLAADVNFRLKCYHNDLLQYSAPEASAALCSNVQSDVEIENVLKCYFDDRQRYNEPLFSALLCSNVKNSADIEKVLNCRSEPSESQWDWLLRCK